MSMTNTHAERAILGAVLHAGVRAYADAADHVGADDWSEERHRLIWQACGHIVEHGSEPDLITITEALRRSGGLADAGGVAYVAELTEGLPDPGNVSQYAELVHDAAIRRGLRSLAVEVQGQVANDCDDTRDIAESASARLADMLVRSDAAAEVFAHDVARSELDRAKRERAGGAQGVRIDTGILGLDRVLDGMRGGQLIILAARTSVGKTALGLQIAANAARHGAGVLVASIEMAREELVHRLLSQMTGVESWRIRDGRLMFNGQDWGDAVEGAAAELRSWRLTIADRGCGTLPLLRSRCRARQLRSGLALVVVDYLQLMRSGERHGGRVEEVSAISRGLKLLAMGLGVPVLALSQLNRESEKRNDGQVPSAAVRSSAEPRLSDLRESGSIENDADKVILLHRRVEGDLAAIMPTVAILAKHRQGPTGRIALRYVAHATRFEEGI